MQAKPTLDWPLMENNITRADLGVLREFLAGDPILTQSSQVREFEREWSQWLGVRYSVLVNSGSSANLITMAAIRDRFGEGDVIVPPITWVSDIASLLQTGMTPVFADIDLRTLGLDTDQVLEKLTPETKAVFLTHILGYDALTDELTRELASREIALIEDCCESHGATHNGKKVGTHGLVSNFSFYYAHHMSTIEGGMVSTDDEELYQALRMYRSHGLVRESSSPEIKARYAGTNPDLTADFTFAFPGYNVRSTEINAVLGRSQLARLDANIEKRTANLTLFLSLLDPGKYFTDFALEGSSNYALTLALRRPDTGLRDRVEETMRALKVEFRRGMSGGGNQLRQPYLRKLFGDEYAKYPVADHVHFFGWYIGNYPDLDPEKIKLLCEALNGI